MKIGSKTYKLKLTNSILAKVDTYMKEVRGTTLMGTFADMSGGKAGETVSVDINALDFGMMIDVMVGMLTAEDDTLTPKTAATLVDKVKPGVMMKVVSDAISDAFSTGDEENPTHSSAKKT